MPLNPPRLTPDADIVSVLSRRASDTEEAIGKGIGGMLEFFGNRSEERKRRAEEAAERKRKQETHEADLAVKGATKAQIEAQTKATEADVARAQDETARAKQEGVVKAVAAGYDPKSLAAYAEGRLTTVELERGRLEQLARNLGLDDIKTRHLNELTLAFNRDIQDLQLRGEEKMAGLRAQADIVKMREMGFSPEEAKEIARRNMHAALELAEADAQKATTEAKDKTLDFTTKASLLTKRVHALKLELDNATTEQEIKATMLNLRKADAYGLYQEERQAQIADLDTKFAQHDLLKGQGALLKKQLERFDTTYELEDRRLMLEAERLALQGDVERSKLLVEVHTAVMATSVAKVKPLLDQLQALSNITINASTAAFVQGKITETLGQIAEAQTFIGSMVENILGKRDPSDPTKNKAGLIDLLGNIGTPKKIRPSSSLTTDQVIEQLPD